MGIFPRHTKNQGALLRGKISIIRISDALVYIISTYSYIPVSFFRVPRGLEFDHRGGGVSSGEDHNEHYGNDDERTYSASTIRVDGLPRIPGDRE